MKSEVKYSFDAAAEATLRNAADGAETATAAETPIDLDRLDKAYWDNGDIANGVFTTVVHVSALDVADADETYTLTFEVDDVSGFTSPTVVGTCVVTATGVYSVILDSDTIKKRDPDARYLRVNATLGGTTPSITYGAWLAPVASA